MYGGPAMESLARYTDLELIGKGVSARVYKAVDTATGGAVAVKALNPHLKTDEISIERFRREIQITRFLNHSQIIAIYDLVSTDNGLYLIMEYVPGSDLKDFLKLHGPLEVATAQGILTQILKVLQVCHRKNVIHRDLKPQNIMIDPEQRIKLLDFGIARMTSLSDLTQTGTSLGSPEYMAPELFATNTFDPRTDLYAVGAITYEMLTGELPFSGDSVPVLFNEHLNAPVPRAAAARSDVPPWLDAVIEKLLAKNAYERYQTAGEALGDIGHRRVVSKSLPKIARRECLSCGRRTASEVPICTFCGYNHRATLERRGEKMDVLTSPDQDRKELERFLAGVFPLTPPLPRRPGTLLASGVDRPSAELLKESALKHGIYLRLRRSSPFDFVVRVVSSYLLLLAAVTLLKSVTVASQILAQTSSPMYMLAEPPSTQKVLAIITLEVLVCWGIYRFFRWAHRRPLLGRKGLLGAALRELAGVVLLITVIGGLVGPLAQTGALSLLLAILLVPVALWWLADRVCGLEIVQRLRRRLPAQATRSLETLWPRRLVAEQDWVQSLAPRLGEIRSEGLQVFASRLIEKYYLLSEHAPEIGEGIRQRLKVLIDSAVGVAVLLSELETAVGDARLADWSRRYLAFRERAAAEPDAERREVLRRSAEAAGERLRRFYRLDEKHGALRGRLIHLQYTFNTLLGKALVFHAPLGGSEARELEAAVSELERDLAVSKEVRRELRELV